MKLRAAAGGGFSLISYGRAPAGDESPLEFLKALTLTERSDIGSGFEVIDYMVGQLDSSRSEEGNTRRPRDRESTRTALIEAATRLFADLGFDGTSTDRIAHAAKVNKALISYHFGGKAGLYRAILSGTFREINERLESADGAGLPADQRLDALIGAFAELHRLRPWFPAMILREVLSGGHHLDEAALPEFLSIFGRVRRLVADGIRDGSFRPVDPLLTHLSVVGSLVFFFATLPLRERLAAEGKIPFAAPTAEQYVRHVRELVSRGLAPNQPESGRR